ncbi:MAG: transposase, partial [Candidatus Thiodiazotropha endolucinida]
MTDCTQEVFDFPALKRRKVQGEFTGGDITSDGGVLLLRQIDRRLGLMKAVDGAIADPRYITHSQLSLLQQRVYGIALGYEDLNDHETLRNDPAIQTSVERDDVLGSQSTLCRLENRVNRAVALRLHEVLLD